MDVEELDHIPIILETSLRNEPLFRIFVPVRRLNRAEVQSVLIEAIEQFLDPKILRSITDEIIRVIEENQN